MGGLWGIYGVCGGWFGSRGCLDISLKFSVQQSDPYIYHLELIKLCLGRFNVHEGLLGLGVPNIRRREGYGSVLMGDSGMVRWGGFNAPRRVEGISQGRFRGDKKEVWGGGYCISGGIGL